MARPLRDPSLQTSICFPWCMQSQRDIIPDVKRPSWIKLKGIIQQNLKRASWTTQFHYCGEAPGAGRCKCGNGSIIFASHVPRASYTMWNIPQTMIQAKSNAHKMHRNGSIWIRHKFVVMTMQLTWPNNTLLKHALRGRSVYPTICFGKVTSEVRWLRW